MISAVLGHQQTKLFLRRRARVHKSADLSFAEHQYPVAEFDENVQVLSDTALRMRVWERGSGVTMACGTGACASVAAATEKGYCRYDTPVSVHLDGGVLTVQVSSDGRISMTGPAELVYEGEVLL